MLSRKDYIDKILPFINQDVVKVLTGLRRSGKTVMLKLIMEELKKLNISDNQIIYINFENLKNRSLNNYENFLTIYILNLMINLRIIIFF